MSRSPGGRLPATVGGPGGRARAGSRGGPVASLPTGQHPGLVPSVGLPGGEEAVRQAALLPARPGRRPPPAPPAAPGRRPGRRRAQAASGAPGRRSAPRAPAAGTPPGRRRAASPRMSVLQVRQLASQQQRLIRRQRVHRQHSQPARWRRTRLPRGTPPGIGMADATPAPAPRTRAPAGTFRLVTTTRPRPRCAHSALITCPQRSSRHRRRSVSSDSTLSMTTSIRRCSISSVSRGRNAVSLPSSASTWTIWKSGSSRSRVSAKSVSAARMSMPSSGALYQTSRSNACSWV